LTEPKRLLVVDDEPNIRRILEVAFEKAGCRVTSAGGAAAAVRELERGPFDCVLTDVTMPGASGYDLQREIAGRWPGTPVVIMTAYGTIPQAVQAIRDGAFEYVPKPFELDALKKVVLAAMSQPSDRRARKAKGAPKPLFIAESSEMRAVLATIEQVADSRATVLLLGESGTGKEVAARMLHALSPRTGMAFVPFSCAAIPETLLESELFGYEKGAFTGAGGAKAGRFEIADGGTLFLDEIGEVPMAVQAKLLRALQEREFERLGAVKPTRVDVRLVAATHRDLGHMVQAGAFRLDLMYRLQVIEIHLPPLRARRDDILPLARTFLARYAAENGRTVKAISPEAEEALLAYAWPGNVRELGNAIERAVVLAPRDAETLEIDALPPALRAAA
jgi:DNA-binding NtrC family response regulator